MKLCLLKAVAANRRLRSPLYMSLSTFAWSSYLRDFEVFHMKSCLSTAY